MTFGYSPDQVSEPDDGYSCEICGGAKSCDQQEHEEYEHQRREEGHMLNDPKPLPTFVKSARRCTLCGGPADLYRGLMYQCQTNPGHVADTVVGIFSDVSETLKE